MFEHQEFFGETDGVGFTNFNPFKFTPGGLKPGDTTTAEDLGLTDTGPMALVTGVGTTTLDPSLTLIALDDTLENKVTTLYFDIIMGLE